MRGLNKYVVRNFGLHRFMDGQSIFQGDVFEQKLKYSMQREHQHK